jgi:hypothetical protein
MVLIYKVEMPVIEYVPITEHFSNISFIHFTILSNFCAIECTITQDYCPICKKKFWNNSIFISFSTCKLKGLQMFVISMLVVKEQHKKHKRMCDSLHQFFLKKKSSRPLSSFNFISFSFLVHFERFRIWWMYQLGLY